MKDEENRSQMLEKYLIFVKISMVYIFTKKFCRSCPEIKCLNTIFKTRGFWIMISTDYSRIIIKVFTSFSRVLNRNIRPTCRLLFLFRSPFIRLPRKKYFGTIGVSIIFLLFSLVFLNLLLFKKLIIGYSA